MAKTILHSFFETRRIYAVKHSIDCVHYVSHNNLHCSQQISEWC